MPEADKTSLTPEQRLSSAEEIQLRSDFMGLTEKDTAVLEELKDRIEKQIPGLFNHFYHHLLRFPETRHLLMDEQVLSRLADSQQQYFSKLLENKHDENYVKERVKIGKVHHQLGVEPKWFLGAYAKYLNGILACVWKEYEDQPKQAMDVFTTIVKNVFFDLSLSFDSYIDAQKKELRKELHKLDSMIVDAIVIVNQKGKILETNKHCIRLLGFKQTEIQEKLLEKILPEIDSETFIKDASQCAQDQDICSSAIHMPFESIAERKSGQQFPVSIQIEALSDTNNYIIIIRDISYQKNANLQIKLLANALQHSADSVMITNVQGIVQYVNPAFSEITGYSFEEIVNAKPSMLKSGLQDDQFYKQLWDALLQGKPFQDVFVNRRKNGDIYYEEKTITPLLDESTQAITHYVSTGKDISQNLVDKERLHYLSNYNPITELPNTHHFSEQISLTIAEAKKSGKFIAVAYLNFNRFKLVSNSIGHEKAENLLKNVAKTFVYKCQSASSIGHLGGDKFTFLLKNFDSIEKVPNFLENLIDIFNEPFIVDSNEIFLNVSIGVSVYPDDGDNAIQLIKNAETAMYRAKEKENRSYQFFTANMLDHATAQLRFEANLRNAIRHNEFKVLFQPEVKLLTGKIAYLEAILRWDSKEYGLLEESQFISHLQELELMSEVEKWLIDQSLNYLEQWQREGYIDVGLSINVLTTNVSSVSYMQFLSEKLVEYNIDPKFIQLGITENVVMDNFDVSMDLIRSLKATGVKIAIDNFGTGKSCLNQIKNIPLQKIKLDECFIENIENDENLNIVKAIIALAHSLQIEVVAKGVEHDIQLQCLHRENCDAIQGLIYSSPMASSAVLDLLHSGKIL